MDTNRFKLSGQNSGSNKNVLIGNAFAFLDSNALKDSDLSWLAKLLGHKPGNSLIVPIAGPGAITLSGVKIAPLKLEQFFLKSIVSDKNLYRHGKDTINLLVLCPTTPNSTVVASLKSSGTVVSKHEIELGRNGEGSFKLRDLLVGDYQLYFDGQEEPACEFMVAEYRLVPLVASMVSSAVGAAESLEVVLHLESFGVPVNGKVKLNLLDRDTYIQTVSVQAVEGSVTATFQMMGAGPHSIAVQLEAEPSKTATVPIRGSREAERKNTVFSSLGTETVGSLLPISSNDPVRGIYLKEGALTVSPVSLDRVDDDRARLSINSNISTMKIIVVDPTFATPVNGAVDVQSAVHPESDPVYKEAEAKFKEGKFAQACQKFKERRSHFEHPHPYYAYWMACCYARAGQVDEAVKALVQSIYDGWTDFAHMESDDDLSSLRDYEPFQKLLVGGRTEISFSNLKAGDKIEVDVPAPLSLLLLGAIIDGSPWEGWASLVTPSAVSATVTVPEVCKPGAKVAIKFETDANETAIYAIIKDARLISADTPEMKLAAAIKKYVDVNGAKLKVGAPTESLKDVLAKLAQSTDRARARGALFGMEGSGSWGSIAGWAPPGSAGDSITRRSMAAPLTSGIFQQEESGWVGQNQDMPPPAGGSWDAGDTWGGSVQPQSKSLKARSAPMPQSPMAPEPPPSFGAPLMARQSLTAAQSVRSAGSVSVDIPTPASRPLVAVSEDPEVLYAGFVMLKKGQGSVKIKLPDSFSNYIIECFAISGMHWASKETRFRTTKDPYVQLTTPVFATKAEPGVGIVHVGSSANAKVSVYFDGLQIPLHQQNGAPFNGEFSGLPTSYTFSAGPGHYETVLEQNGQVVATHAKRVDEPGKLKRVVRSLRVLTAGDAVALKDDSAIVSFQIMEGLENDFTALIDATADYSHCCCEQTAAKIMSGCAMYLQACGGGDDNRRKLAESVIIAGVKREQSMWLRGQGFKSYPHVSAIPDQYVGPRAARYLWNLGMLETNSQSGAMSKELKEAIASGLEMAKDTTSAYNLSWPPKSLQSCEDAYNALCFEPGVDSDAALKLVRAQEKNETAVMPDPFLGISVGTRLEQAYAAAALLRKGTGNDIKIALKLANIVISQFNEYGRLYSTVDSVAAIALMTELQKAGITKGGGTIELNGKAIPSEQATNSTDVIHSLKVLEGAVTVAIDRTVEEDWKKFEGGVKLRISLEKRGEHTRRFTAGDSIDLVVELEDGYVMGDLLWVALPDALSRVVGGGQVKLFALDFAGANQLRVSLAATGITAGINHAIQEQSLALCVRNMFNEERAGNPGLIKISVQR